MIQSPIGPHPFLRLALAVVLVPAVWAVAEGVGGEQAERASSPSSSPEPPPTLADARDSLMEGYYERATEAFERLADEPEHARGARLGLARCRLQTGKYLEALSGLIALDAKDSSEWHYLLADTYSRFGRYEAVLKHAQLAIELNKDDAASRYLRATMLEYLGRRDEAIEEYRWFDRQLVERAELRPDARWLTYTAQGFLRYSVLTRTDVARRTDHVLNNMLVEAYGRLDRSYWPARIAAADLLCEKYNNDEDDGSVSDYRAALRINSNLPEAHVGLGRVMLQRWNFKEVERRAELALEINPNFAPAIYLLSGKLVTERRYKEALETCERALAVNPNDLAALSFSAVASACLYDKAAVDEMARRVARINPRCAFFHRAMGDAFSGIHQYPASEREYLKAIELDPTDANARTELGMMYMLWGEEEKARDVLDAAWELDKFNERTKFTLELLDMLDDFARYESEHFIIKYKEETDPGLGEYVANYLEDTYQQITDDYNWSLKKKTIIEIFPTHRQFAVRISGRPWIQTVGACTGRVIAMDSARHSPDLPYGPYNLGRVLRHEFTHTVTLAATDFRIPRWFTEGLAVMQEEAPRSFSWSQLLANAVRRDELFTLEEIDWRFIRPKKITDSTQAYAQGEWMVEYIIERFGYDTINQMIEAYYRGLTQPEVTRTTLGIDMERFDQDFKVWARKQVETWGFDLIPPENAMMLRALALVSGDDADVQSRLARAEFEAENFEQALTAARKALELDENEPHGLEVLCKVLAKYISKEQSEAGIREYEEEALPALRRLAKIDPNNWTAPRGLAGIALRREEYDDALDHLKTLQRICPRDPFSWSGLAGIYLKRNQDELALIQLMELARTNEHDPEIPGQIGRIFKRKGELGEARYWLGQALLIDPFGVELHEDLGEVSMRAGDSKAALREYRMLTKLEPEEPKHFEKAAFAAHKLGDKEAAGKFATKAVSLDPESAAKPLTP